LLYLADKGKYFYLYYLYHKCDKKGYVLILDLSGMADKIIKVLV